MAAVPVPKSKEEVTKYATMHNLEERLSAAVNAAIAAGSPDPIAHIASLLTGEASKDVVDYAAVKREVNAAPTFDAAQVGKAATIHA